MSDSIAIILGCIVLGSVIGTAEDLQKSFPKEIGRLFYVKSQRQRLLSLLLLNLVFSCLFYGLIYFIFVGLDQFLTL